MQGRQIGGVDKIAAAADIIPSWRVRLLQVRPYESMWAFNPSVHYDGHVWRCAVRCADYSMPGGVQIRGPNASKHGGVTTKNLIVHLDPATFRVLDVFPVAERDNVPRNRAANRGYEDMRLFATASGGLQGVAAAAHLERKIVGDTYPPEQVIVSFDDRYHIVRAEPVRGAAWAGPQKNWAPFDGADEPRFLYSIGRGIVFSATGPIGGMPPPEDAGPPKPTGPLKRPPRAAGPASNSEMRNAPQAHNLTPTLVPSRSRYLGLRGGTQLVHIGDGLWLGLGHEMMLARTRKIYWHAWYVVDSDGVLQYTSRSMKLAPEGIEFAAGLVVDHERDRVVVSMGVDDHECRIATADIRDVMACLRPYEPPAEAPAPSAAGASGWVHRDVDPSPHVRQVRRPAPPTGTGYRPARGPRIG